jgi:exodeoxyribonuclease-5
MNPSPKIELSPEQREAVATLLRFGTTVQTLGGYAGTGKSTVIQELARRRPRFAVCAYTGKAANVLRRRGIQRAATIHSTIYQPTEEQYQDKQGKLCRRLVFKLKSRSMVPFEGFIVDEASMVDRNIYEALCSFALPLIFVGDHGQLEPVNGSDFNLMAAPDITLETIHRNAGEIARFAEFVRHGNVPSRWPGQPGCSGTRVRFLTWDSLKSGTVPDPDQIIVAFNWQRLAINELAREHHGLPKDIPAVGDRVMCLRNNRLLGVFNGMQGEIVALAGKELVFRSQGRDYRTLYVPEAFGALRMPEIRNGGIPFDWAWAITCHKAQGDEWNSVMVFEKRSWLWNHARWAYTAASRARQSLYWVEA